MRSLAAALVLLVIALPALAELPPVPVPLEEFAHYVMRENPSAQQAEQRAIAVDDAVGEVAHPAARLLFPAMSEFLVGFVVLGNGDPERARQHFQRAVAGAEAANEIEPSSEAYRLLADAHNQLLDTGSVSYKIFNAWRARDAAERAVELDPANPLAHIAAASYFVSAPGIAGGDQARGARHIAQARELGGGSEYVRFLADVWDGRLAAARNRPQQAEAAFARAHAVYPGNWWLEQIARTLQIPLP